MSNRLGLDPRYRRGCSDPERQRESHAPAAPDWAGPYWLLAGAFAATLTTASAVVAALPLWVTLLIGTPSGRARVGEAAAMVSDVATSTRGVSMG